MTDNKNLAAMNTISQDIPDKTVCIYNHLYNPAERAAEYFIPDLGTLRMRYDGEYKKDREENRLDPTKFIPSVVLCYGMPYIDIVFDGFVPAILPNPDQLTFGTTHAQPVKELMSQLDRSSRALYETRRVINVHFPTEKRLTDQN